MNVNKCVTYLCSRTSNSIPIQTGKDILQKRGIVIYLPTFELGVAKMKGEGERGGFAGFYGAGEEVDCEEFHGDSSLFCVQ